MSLLLAKTAKRVSRSSKTSHAVKRASTQLTRGRVHNAAIRAYTKQKTLNAINTSQVQLRATVTAQPNQKTAITLPTFIEII